MSLIGNPPILVISLTLLAVWLLDEAVRPKLWRGYTVLKIALFIVTIFQIGATMSRAGWFEIEGSRSLVTLYFY